MENKICKNCNIEKNINEFPKMGGKLCKICFNEYMRLNRGSDKETYNKNIEKSDMIFS